MSKCVTRLYGAAIGTLAAVASGGVGTAAPAASGPSVVPLTAPVIVGNPVPFAARGRGRLEWDFGDGGTGRGVSSPHTYQKAGIYKVTVASAGGADRRMAMIVRALATDSPRVPQVMLDTDARNEVDDQYYIAYAIYSGLDVLGINSIHHGGGEEPINYGEIFQVLKMSTDSGLAKDRKPMVFHGADRRLEVPPKELWTDTEPVTSEASQAILAVARGASPGNPVWLLPVGPGTNVASAVLEARREGLDLQGRLQIVWLGGGPVAASKGTFNGSNDPWSIHVLGQSGLPLWIILEHPNGCTIFVDKRTEADVYPRNALGRYLQFITPAQNRGLCDPSAVSAVIAQHLGRPWLLEIEPVTVLPRSGGYLWQKAAPSSRVRLVRDYDRASMKKDLFDTLNGKPTNLGPGS